MWYYEVVVATAAASAAQKRGSVSVGWATDRFGDERLATTTKKKRFTFGDGVDSWAFDPLKCASSSSSSPDNRDGAVVGCLLAFNVFDFNQFSLYF